MTMTSEAGRGTASEGTEGEIRAPKGKGASPMTKIAVIVTIAALLVAVPMGYIVLTADDDGSVDLVVALVGKSAEREVDYSDLEDMDFTEATSSYQNRFGNWKGLGTYGGVELRDLADLVGGMEPDDMMSVVASDGYRVNLTYDQVYADEDFLAVQGPIILAYMFNGTFMDEEDRPMVAVLAPDGEFSNDDFNETRSADAEFDYLTSAGSLWIKTVERIEVSELDRGEVVLTVEGDTTKDLTLSGVKALGPYTASGGFVKTTGAVVGPWEMTGVPVRDLVSMVHSGDGYGVEVVATDGYTMTYSQSQVEDGTFAHYDVDGNLLGTGDFTMVVAYEMDGEPLEDMVLRVAVIDESSPITDGHFWAKYVRTVRVVPFVEDYTLALNGTTVYAMDRQTLESVAACEYHQASWSFENETGTHAYTGVALWTLVSVVDGADGPDNEFLFNDLLALAGYTVRVTADDGYNKTFTSREVARNDSIIVANKLDGEPLPEGEFPLRIVGDWLPSSMRVSQVANISLEGLQAMPDWELTIIGTETVTISAETFASTYYSGLHGPWFNYTDYGGWHAAYYNYTDGEEADHTYAGIPLWVLVAAADGEDAFHYEFNETLADAGYDVRVTASDEEYSATFPISTVAYNDSLIVAFMLDWSSLVDTEYPLRLVGDYLLNSEKVKSVGTIELVGLPT